MTIIIIIQSQKHDRGGPLYNNNSGPGVYKIITLIIDIAGMGGGGQTNKNDIYRHRNCNKHINTKGHLSIILFAH